AAAGKADGARNVLCDGCIGSVQLHIACNQNLSRAHRNRASRSMQPWSADVRRVVRIAWKGIAESLELSLAHGLEWNTLRPQCSSLIKVDGNFVAPPDFVTRAMRDFDAFFHCDAAHRHKGKHVGGPDARMHA